MKEKKYSRLVTWFVAWIGCGLLLPLYINDKPKFDWRMKCIKNMIPWCLVLIGFFIIMLYLLFWSLSDQFNCIFGTLKRSDGSRVW